MTNQGVNFHLGRPTASRPGGCRSRRRRAAAGEPGGHVQHPEPLAAFGSARGQVAVQGEQLQPGGQIGGERREPAPRPEMIAYSAGRGIGPSPVSLATRMRSSARARRRCRSSRSGS